jgi:VWFA-related protein
MRIRIIMLWMGALLAGAGGAGARQVEQTSTPTVIRSETKLVLVDAVVTDKKGNYVTDLTQKDFEVLEDSKKQTIKTFGFEADPNSPMNNQKHYLVLFFDNASSGYGDQIQARQAAAKFIDGNTGPNKYIAIVNFTGSLRITQNFTNDPERLKAVVSGVKMATVSTGGDGSGMGLGGGFPNMNSAATDFGVRSVLLALRSLARGLEGVAGRKTVIMLTAGFPLTSETRAELTVTIDACNRANVAVYPLDVRGLAAPAPGMQPGGPIIREEPMALLRSPALGAPSWFHLASFSNSFMEPNQARGGSTGGSTGGGSTGGGASAGGATGSAGSRTGGSAGGGTGGSTGSTGGSRGGSTGATGSTGTGGSTGTSGGRGGTGGGGGTTTLNPSMTNRNLLNMNPRSIVPPFPPNMGINDSALYMLADGTGGFVIHNTNDLLSGMEKIARDQNQYYILGYSPEDSPEGSCHALKVKVNRGGNSVRSRSGYCNVRVVDALAGKPAETELEGIAAGTAAGSIVAPLQLPFFYSSPNVARVNVAMEIPAKSFHFEKVKGKQHAEVNLLGVAYKPDGSVGAKFSDTVKFDFDTKAQVEEFQQKPLHYENQFEIASGTYSFKVVFSGGGQDFGKLEKPLTIDAFDGKGFALSGLALSHDRLSTEGDAGLDAVLIEDKVPLLARGVQFIPAGSSVFKTTEASPGLYLEIYEPHLLDEKPPQLAVQLKVSDRKGGALKIDSGLVPMDIFVRKDSPNPVVPVGLRLPVSGLVAGGYRLELTALDTLGKSVTRSVDFDVE